MATKLIVPYNRSPQSYNRAPLAYNCTPPAYNRALPTYHGAPPECMCASWYITALLWHAAALLCHITPLLQSLTFLLEWVVLWFLNFACGPEFKENDCSLHRLSPPPPLLSMGGQVYVFGRVDTEREQFRRLTTMFGSVD